MSEQHEPLKENEVAILPVDADRGLALVLGGTVTDAPSWRLPRGLISDALNTGGLLGGASAAKSLLDGSLVALAPETLARLKDGAVFIKDSRGFALGTLTEKGKGFTNAVRFVEGAANPVAAGMLLQTMAVQMQLKQIQETLEEISEKLDTLLAAQRHGVLAEVIATGHGVHELNDKVWAGHALTDADEIKLRDYEDIARRHLAEAELWMQELNQLLQLEDPSLKAQYEALEGALRREPVAFWLRVYVVSHVVLGEVRKLRLFRSAAAEPDYARGLNATIQAQLADSARSLQALCSDIDRYLRRSDIAAGLEELSLLRKAKVRKLRRQLWEVDKQLKASLQTSRGMYEAIPGLEPIEIPAPLDRRAVEPWVVRDNLYDTVVAATDRSLDAVATAADRGAAVLRDLNDRRRAKRDSETWLGPDDQA